MFQANQRYLFCFLVSLLLFMVSPPPGFAEGKDIPVSLKEWIPWVLHESKDYQCTQLLTQEKKICVWPKPLELHLQESGGKFSQHWELQGEGWIFLPGGEKNWPHDVMINEEKALVVNHGGRPAILIESAGQYHVHGEFRWSSLPEKLALPQGSTIISPFSLRGGDQPYPDISGDQLYLSARQSGDSAKEQDTLSLQVFRHITDSVPLLMRSRIELQVSGKPREVLLDWEAPENQVPLLLESALPVRLEQGNRIRAQVRAGKHVITYHSRTKGEVSQLSLGSGQATPQEEIWSFEAQPHLRTVKIEGVAAIDPSQTALPPQWHGWPAYLVKKGENFTIRTLKRGDPEPAPNNINLDRTLWLDYDGQGFTVQDSLSGTVSRSRRLEMQPPAQLGRVVINGRDQLITTLKGQTTAGVEVRQGRIAATAVSRMEGVRSFPAGGWSQDISRLSGRVHLPPGWKALHVQGVDSANTWIADWTLLDCFIVLVIVFATGQLLGITRGLVAFVVLVLTYQDHGAPIYLWLAILASIALLRALSESSFAGRIRFGKLILLVSLILTVLPYSVKQLRVGFYPQLDSVYSSSVMPTTYGYDQEGLYAPAPQEMMDEAVAVTKQVRQGSMLKGSKVGGQRPEQKRKQLYSYDTNAKIQAGPGVPGWQWRQLHLRWSGPVDAALQVKLFLLSPMVNLVLAILKVASLLLLTFFMFETKLGGIRSFTQKATKTASPAILAMILIPAAFLVPPSSSQASEYPDPTLLNKLKERLLERPTCSPHCADLQEIDISMQGNSINLSILASSLTQSAVPLPWGESIFWKSILVDGKSTPVYGGDGGLWLPLNQGEHSIVLSGVTNRSPFQLRLPLKPHFANFSGKDEWSVEGISDGVPGDQLQITRREEQQSKEEFATSNLPPFIQIERILHFDVEWQVETIVTRLSPTGTVVYFTLPLLEGEAVMDPALEVQESGVMGVLAAGETQKRWFSSLRQQENINLRASETTHWVEVWRLDANPIWHVEASGLVPVHHHSPAGVWQPEWRPWPGEQIQLSITRPQGVAGETKAIDSSKLKVFPGLRSTDMKLSFSIRSTRGDNQQVTLPEGAVIQAIRINGKEQPFGNVSNNSGKVSIPLNPGTQLVEIDWRMARGIATLFQIPAVNLGNASVNSDIEINVSKRWVWFLKGPAMGPAILFYTELLILLLVAVILGRMKLTPLNSMQWIILGLGLTQSGLITCTIIVLWFIGLEQRRRFAERLSGIKLNLTQILLGILSIAAFGAIIYAVRHGLLGHPDMVIEGNQSSSYLLRWYQDRVPGTLAQPMVISFPIMAYRLVMLLWALWLAFSFIKWIKWGWGCFASEKLWQTVWQRKPRKKKGAKMEEQVISREADQEADPLPDLPPRPPREK